MTNLTRRMQFQNFDNMKRFETFIITLSVLFRLKNPCNGQSGNNLGSYNQGKGLDTANKPESNSGEGKIDADIVVLDKVDQKHPVSQALRDPIPEKLARVNKKYYQYERKKVSVIKILD